jgi:uncharacterized membrane protein YjjB (DUF3815 family)
MNILRDWLWLFVVDAFWSGVAAAGFAMLFNVPRRLLWACALVGALGHAVRTLLIDGGLTLVPSTLIGALVVGGVSSLLAQRLKAADFIFSAAGAIPMIPGRFAYNTMLGLIGIASATPENGTTLLVQVTANAANTALILSALALGIALPSLLLHRPKPVV